MAAPRKVFDNILRARSDANIRFDDLCRVLQMLGFSERIKGSHHIFWQDKMTEIVNLQPGGGGKAKPYQVKQVRRLITDYGLEMPK